MPDTRAWLRDAGHLQREGEEEADAEGGAIKMGTPRGRKHHLRLPDGQDRRTADGAHGITVQAETRSPPGHDFEASCHAFKSGNDMPQSIVVSASMRAAWRAISVGVLQASVTAAILCGNILRRRPFFSFGRTATRIGNVDVPVFMEYPCVPRRCRRS